MPKPFRASHHIHTRIHCSIFSQTPDKHSGKTTQASLCRTMRNHTQLSRIGSRRKNRNSGKNGNTLRLPQYYKLTQSASLHMHSGKNGKKNGNGGKSGNTISSSSTRNSRRYAPNYNLPGKIPATIPAMIPATSLATSEASLAARPLPFKGRG